MALLDQINSINNVSNSINKVTRDIDANVHKVEAITGALESNLGNLTQSITGISSTITNTVNTITNLPSNVSSIISSNVQGVTGAISSLGGSVKASFNAISSIGQGAQSIATNMSGKLEEAGVVGGVVKGTVNSVNNMVSSGSLIKTQEASSLVNEATSANKWQTASNLMYIAKSAGGIQIYPSDLYSKVDSWMSLNFYKYQKPNAQSRGSMTATKSYILPLPQNLAQSTSVQISQFDQGTFAQMNETLTPLSKTLVESAISGKKVTQEDISPIVKSITGKGVAEGTGAFAYNMASSALGAVSPDAVAYIESLNGMTANPYTTVHFKNVELRTHTFSWTFVPRKETESNTLRDMIKEIKKSILPARNGFILDYPDIVKPSIEGKAKEWITPYHNCMVRSFSVNYSPEGSSAFFHNGAPVSVQINMDMTEMEIETRELVDEDKF